MLSIDCASRVITVPKADLTLLGAGLYELDVDAFRLALKDWEDSEVGMAMPGTHSHNTTVSLSGVNYARTVEIINGYTVTFEDGIYTVKCVGANHNLGDVKNVNSVSLVVGNSAGLIVVAADGGALPPSASEIATAIWDELLATTRATGSFGAHVRDRLLTTGKFIALKD